MNCTDPTQTTRKCLVLVALPTGERGGLQGRVWDFDSGVLAELRPIAVSRHGRCEHCGVEGEPMLRVEIDGALLAFCDNGFCTVSVSDVATFDVRGVMTCGEGVEYLGLWLCDCGRQQVVHGPAGNWTLAFCPEPCGRGVLYRPDEAAALRVAS